MCWRRWVSGKLMTVAGWMDEEAVRLDPAMDDAVHHISADQRVRVFERLRADAVEDRDRETGEDT
jgi:hypothetical protein